MKRYWSDLNGGKEKNERWGINNGIGMSGGGES
jgi:hypothetical protein